MTARTQIESAMAQLIAVREDLMVDECTVTRPGERPATPELDPDTGMPVTDPETLPPVYAGPCTVADPSSALQGHRTVNDEAGVPHERALRLPVGSTELKPGDLVTITGAMFSPGLVDEVFVIVADEDHRTYTTHDRYRMRGSSWESS